MDGDRLRWGLRDWISWWEGKPWSQGWCESVGEKGWRLRTSPAYSIFHSDFCSSFLSVATFFDELTIEKMTLSSFMVARYFSSFRGKARPYLGRLDIAIRSVHLQKSSISFSHSHSQNCFGSTITQHPPTPLHNHKKPLAWLGITLDVSLSFCIHLFRQSISSSSSSSSSVGKSHSICFMQYAYALHWYPLTT